MKTRLLQMTLILMLGGCTWVSLTPGGQQVRVATMDEVQGCQKLGSTRSITKASLGRINRNSAKVATETETIARNEAARMGGNTIVPLAQMDDGEQDFGVYQCPR